MAVDGAARRPLLRFGVEATTDVRAEAIAGRIEDGAFVTVFTLRHRSRARVRLPLAGRHNVSNALGAGAAAHAAGVALPAIVAGLQRDAPVSGRLQLKPGPRGSWLIDDSYNANPSSVRAGIDVLSGLPGEHWLVLGEMAELGDETVPSQPASVTTRGAQGSPVSLPWAPRRATPRIRSARARAGTQTRRTSATRWPRASSPE